jgi:ADP-heptose:LPS heptosyltransferase
MLNHDEKIRSIAIFRALKLGDMLCAVPALRAIRKAYPSAHISLIGLVTAESLVERYRDYIDEFIAFPGFPGMPETKCSAKEVLEFLSNLQGNNFDLAIQLHGSGELSNSLVSLFGAKSTAGLYRSEHFCPDLNLYSIYPDDVSEVHRCISAVRKLGIEEVDDNLEFSLLKEDFIAADEFLRSSSLARESYFCIHPGASAKSKRWSPLNFARIADSLVEKGNAVIFTGSSVEADLVAEIRDLMNYHSVDAASLNLALGPLGALIKSSRGMICNDTGVSHLCAALRVPSIVIFSETDPVRWAPLNHNLHQWIYRPSVEEVSFKIKHFFINPILTKNIESTEASNWEAM